MNLRRVLTVSAIALGLSAAFVSTAAAQYPPTTGTGTVSAGSVTSGDCVTFSGTGFEPGSTVTIADNGTQTTVATADANGNISVEVCPTGVGEHVLSATGTSVAGEALTVTAEVTVLASSGGGLPATGSSIVIPATAIGLSLILLGAAFVFVFRRRRVVQFS